MGIKVISVIRAGAFKLLVVKVIIYSQIYIYQSRGIKEYRIIIIIYSVIRGALSPCCTCPAGSPVQYAIRYIVSNT